PAPSQSASPLAKRPVAAKPATEPTPPVVQSPAATTPPPPAEQPPSLLKIQASVEQVPAEVPPPSVTVSAEARKESLFARLKRGLARSTETFTGGIASIFQGKAINEAQIQELEDLLITADIGVPTAERIVGAIRAAKAESGTTIEDFKSLLASEVE